MPSERGISTSCIASQLDWERLCRIRSLHKVIWICNFNIFQSIRQTVENANCCPQPGAIELIKLSTLFNMAKECLRNSRLSIELDTQQYLSLPRVQAYLHLMEHAEHSCLYLRYYLGSGRYDTRKLECVGQCSNLRMKSTLKVPATSKFETLTDTKFVVAFPTEFFSTMRMLYPVSISATSYSCMPMIISQQNAFKTTARCDQEKNRIAHAQLHSTLRYKSAD